MFLISYFRELTSNEHSLQISPTYGWFQLHKLHSSQKEIQHIKHQEPHFFLNNSKHKRRKEKNANCSSFFNVSRPTGGAICDYLFVRKVL